MTDQRAEILLVEDNPNDVKLTMNAFKTANLANSVHVARDGVEALEFLIGAASSPDEKLSERPKLILLDLKLPRLDGHEVLKCIKSDPRTSAIPVVIPHRPRSVTSCAPTRWAPTVTSSNRSTSSNSRNRSATSANIG